MNESTIPKKLYVIIIVLLIGVIPLSWGLYIVFYKDHWFLGEQLAFAEMGLVLFIELASIIFFAATVNTLSAKQKLTKKSCMRGFTYVMLLGIMIRAGILPFLFSGIWYVAPIMLIYFLSNFFPIYYLKRNTDAIFTPVFAGRPSSEKKELLYAKYKITKREKDIVEAICKGMTNKQIADELFISLQTVKDHTHRIYSKIGINSRLKLVQLVNG